MITETFKDKGRGYRWRIKSPNGRIVAVSGEAFVSASNARRALNNVLAMVVDSVRAELADEILASREDALEAQSTSPTHH